MNILLHTIALEPARWTPQRVSRALTDLIPRIAAAGFSRLEIYEPHLTRASDVEAVREALARYELEPVVLSSYLDIAGMSEDDFACEGASLLDRARFFGFKKVRLFPAPGTAADDAAKIEKFTERIRDLADRAPGLEFLLETHDGSLADIPERLVEVLKTIGRKNVGLLWQSTFFSTEFARRQFGIQKPFIRHVHLQNRTADGGFVPLREGVIPWHEILRGSTIDASLEFVASGICSIEDFDLDRTLCEAASEAEYARALC